MVCNPNNVKQFHGDYDKDTFTEAAPAWRSIHAVSYSAPDLRVGAYGDDMLLVDAPKVGSGESWDYASVAGLAGRWLLAGGLSPDTVRQARQATSASRTYGSSRSSWRRRRAKSLPWSGGRG
jgi:phosphoribosylanthranilate isomerase